LENAVNGIFFLQEKIEAMLVTADESSPPLNSDPTEDDSCNAY